MSIASRLLVEIRRGKSQPSCFRVILAAGLCACSLAACGTTDLIATQLLTEDENRSNDTLSKGGSSTTHGNGATHTGGLTNSSALQALAPSPTLQAKDGALLDHCGTSLLLRGTNELLVWSDPMKAKPWIREIAQTGANALRIIWGLDSDEAELGDLLTTVAAEGMVSSVQLRGVNEELPEEVFADIMVARWTSKDMLLILNRHEKSLLLEIGKGHFSARYSEWVGVYQKALADLRKAGIRMPIVVRSPSWRDEIDVSILAQKEVIEADPLRNSMVSFTMWGDDESFFKEYVSALKEAQIPAYLAEFSGFLSTTCPAEATNLDQLLTLTSQYDVGWFAWSWGGVRNQVCKTGPLDMTEDGTLAGLFGWGRVVALEHPQGISRTSIPLQTSDLVECP